MDRALRHVNSFLCRNRRRPQGRARQRFGGSDGTLALDATGWAVRTHAERSGATGFSGADPRARTGLYREGDTPVRASGAQMSEESAPVGAAGGLPAIDGPAAA
ncbi:hypothetical protein GCM10010425_43660 [Streptomyces spororaveus]|uniref:Uncharacterized protein n=1 Tax=Streptomyces spororaveus TaxID=284039 RepID=A0ABQ3TML3_9ACTN|nr:hypothetical protein Sspor_72020 [Streptomyces spororaveus]